MGLPIPEYPDYIIETDGRIYSTIRNIWLKPSVGNNGYYGVELRNAKGHKRISVHRLVALTFLPNPYNYPQVNHKDENKLNNDVTNLEWCTAKYNMNYGIGAKTRHKKIDYTKPSYILNAINNGKKTSKPVERYTLSGKYIDSFKSINDAIRQLELTSNHISECASGKRASSNGYIWKYEGRDDLSVYQF